MIHKNKLYRTKEIRGPRLEEVTIVSEIFILLWMKMFFFLDGCDILRDHVACCLHKRWGKINYITKADHSYSHITADHSYSYITQLTSFYNHQITY